MVGREWTHPTLPSPTWRWFILLYICWIVLYAQPVIGWLELMIINICIYLRNVWGGGLFEDALKCSGLARRQSVAAVGLDSSGREEPGARPVRGPMDWTRLLQLIFGSAGFWGNSWLCVNLSENRSGHQLHSMRGKHKSTVIKWRSSLLYCRGRQIQEETFHFDYETVMMKASWFGKTATLHQNDLLLFNNCVSSINLRALKRMTARLLA